MRSIVPQEGESLDAILSRAEYYLKKRDVKKALFELKALDSKSATIFSDWIRLANSVIENMK